MNVKVKKLDPSAHLPVYSTPYSAGADLFACLKEDVEILPGQTQLIHTGIAVELVKDTVGLVFARSGLATKKDLAPANKVGVIDADYRGEIMVALFNHGKEKRVITDGERIAQLLIMPYYTADFEEAEFLSDTVRGEGGFGSTGR